MQTELRSVFLGFSYIQLNRLKDPFQVSTHDVSYS